MIMIRKSHRIIIPPSPPPPFHRHMSITDGCRIEQQTLQSSSKQIVTTIHVPTKTRTEVNCMAEEKKESSTHFTHLYSMVFSFDWLWPGEQLLWFSVIMENDSYKFLFFATIHKNVPGHFLPLLLQPGCARLLLFGLFNWWWTCVWFVDSSSPVVLSPISWISWTTSTIPSLGRIYITPLTCTLFIHYSRHWERKTLSKQRFLDSSRKSIVSRGERISNRSSIDRWRLADGQLDRIWSVWSVVMNCPDNEWISEWVYYSDIVFVSTPNSSEHSNSWRCDQWALPLSDYHLSWSDDRIVSRLDCIRNYDWLETLSVFVTMANEGRWRVSLVCTTQIESEWESLRGLCLVNNTSCSSLKRVIGQIRSEIYWSR